MSHAESLQRVLTATSWRTAVLLALGSLLGTVLHAIRPSGLRFESYSPPAMCSGSPQEQEEIHALKPELAARLCGDPRTLVADVRRGADFARGHVAGAVHIPCSGSRADVEQVRLRVSDKEALVVYGDSEEQARQVARDLVQRIGRPGLSVSVIAGGWRAWFDAGLACASGPCDDCEGLVSHAPQ